MFSYCSGSCRIRQYLLYSDLEIPHSDSLELFLKNKLYMDLWKFENSQSSSAFLLRVALFFCFSYRITAIAIRNNIIAITEVIIEEIISHLFSFRQN